MIKICGANRFNRLIRESNNKDSNGNPIISPPLDIKNDSLLSCSFYSSHSAIITQEGKLHVIGYNEDCSIIPSLPKEPLEQLTELPVKDNNGNELFPISVVCGSNYILLLVSTSIESDSERRLAYYSFQEGTKNPIFPSIGNCNPVSLFGGSYNSAAIDSEGGIIFITGKAMEKKSVYAPRVVLPDGEAAVSVACCDDFFYAVGSSGRVFISPAECPTDMKIASELIGVTINEVSGTNLHCIAVSSDGRVFGRGLDLCGCLGFEWIKQKATQFTEIFSMSKHKIISAAAGGYHSLFISDRGKVFACGSNSSGQLLLRSGPRHDKFSSPVATSITRGAAFCIAGAAVSAVFIGKVPPNTPNQPVCHNSQPHKTKSIFRWFTKDENK